MHTLSSLNVVERNALLCIEASVLVAAIMLEKGEVAKFIFPSFVAWSDNCCYFTLHNMPAFCRAISWRYVIKVCTHFWSLASYKYCAAAAGYHRTHRSGHLPFCCELKTKSKCKMSYFEQLDNQNTWIPKLLLCSFNECCQSFMIFDTGTP